MFLGLPPGKYTGTASAERRIATNVNSASNGKVLPNTPFNEKCIPNDFTGVFNFFLMQYISTKLATRELKRGQ